MYFTTFSTHIGAIGIVWSNSHIEHVRLPEASLTTLKAKLKDLGAVETMKKPAFVSQAVKIITRHLTNGTEDLSLLATHLNWQNTPAFHQKVYKALLKVPAGQVVTYKTLAERARSPKAMRAVGQAMAKNRFPLLIPCHRVIQASGALGRFSAHEGASLKAKLLQLEGAPEVFS